MAPYDMASMTNWNECQQENNQGHAHWPMDPMDREWNALTLVCRCLRGEGKRGAVEGPLHYITPGARYYFVTYLSPSKETVFAAESISLSTGCRRFRYPPSTGRPLVKKKKREVSVCSAPIAHCFFFCSCLSKTLPWGLLVLLLWELWR